MISEYIFIIQVVFTVICSIIASYFDIKHNIIPDRISLLLVLFGLTSNLILSLLTNNIKHILSSIISGILTYVVCYLLWKLKIWGGGDVKLLTGIATAIPFCINIPFLNISPDLSIYLFSFSVILNAIIISFPFLICMIFYLNMKNVVFNSNGELFFNLLNYKNLLFFIRSNFNKSIKIQELKEGMIVNDFYFNDERIVNLIANEKSNLKVYKLKNDPDYKYCFKSVSAGGITKKDMYQLKIMNSQKIISDYINIKLGFPFAPAITIALIITIFMGDIMMILSKHMVLVI